MNYIFLLLIGLIKADAIASILLQDSLCASLDVEVAVQRYRQPAI
jgi:hypothetical protein